VCTNHTTLTDDDNADDLNRFYFAGNKVTMAYTERRRIMRLGAAVVMALAATTSQAFLITKPTPRYYTSLPGMMMMIALTWSAC